MAKVSFREIRQAVSLIGDGVLMQPVSREQHDAAMALKVAVRYTHSVCANPDLIVHKGGNVEYCAGSIAKLYEKMGGSVKYFGKPYRNVYDYAFGCLKKNYKKNINKRKVLVIGDNLNTDILGANNFKVKNLFIAGGIHKSEWNKKNTNLAKFIINKNKYFKINYFQNELIW